MIEFEECTTLKEGVNCTVGILYDFCIMKKRFVDGYQTVLDPNEPMVRAILNKCETLGEIERITHDLKMDNIRLPQWIDKYCEKYGIKKEVPVKAFKVWDVLHGEEALGLADNLREIKALARRQYAKTNGECRIVYAHFDQNTGRYDIKRAKWLKSFVREDAK